MGDFKSYNPSEGFDQYLYYQVGDTITADNGVQGKVIDEYSNKGTGAFHSSLPMCSNTSEVYLKKSDKGDHPIEQARMYEGRKVAMDFDWGHTHGKYGKGVVHVHVWQKDEKRQMDEK